MTAIYRRLEGDLEREYRAKGWPVVNPYSRDYCYRPCRFGLHVCGHHPDGMNCMTIANFPTRTAAEAVALFEAAKAELAEPEGEDGDFVVDLQIDHDCECDFMLNRQMLARLEVLARAFPATSDLSGSKAVVPSTATPPGMPLPFNNQASPVQEEG